MNKTDREVRSSAKGRTLDEGTYIDTRGQSILARHAGVGKGIEYTPSSTPHPHRLCFTRLLLEERSVYLHCGFPSHRQGYTQTLSLSLRIFDSPVSLFLRLFRLNVSFILLQKSLSFFFFQKTQKRLKGEDQSQGEILDRCNTEDQRRFVGI